MAVDQLDRGGAAGGGAGGSLKRIGLEPGDRVALVSENRPEWLIADLAIMAAGCVTVPTYTTNTTRDHAHVLGNSGARAVIVSNQKLAKNLVPAVLTSAECHHIIGIEEIRAGQAPDWVNVHQWEELTGGEADVGGARASDIAGVGRDDLACIIYTSGTGGAPRGVRQHHGAILHNVGGCDRHHLERLRLGRRGVPVLPSRQPRL